MKKLFICAALAPFAFAFTGVQAAEKAAEHGAEHHPHWSYKGKTSAPHWGDLEPGFEACKIGQQQSPIDIRAAKKGDLPAIGFNYAASPAEIVNNGHTIQVNLAEGGNVKLASGEYKLLQLHFHSPSEEKVNKVAYPMNAHLVHRNAEGKLAVVSVFFKQGKANPALAKIFDAMPAHADEKAELKEGFNAAELLPEAQGYYSYVGSLTTPPCSEGVQWQVMKTPVTASKAQLNAFRKLYPMNARPVQPLHGRTIEAG